MVDDDNKNDLTIDESKNNESKESLSYNSKLPNKDNPKKNKIIWATLIIVLLISSIAIFAMMSSKPVNAEEMHKKILCPCCGKPISTKCCGMAKQRIDEINLWIQQGMNEKEVLIEVAKNYGIEAILDKTLQQDILKEIEKEASKDAPKISIDPIQYNFGDVSQSKGIVSTFMKIKNTGKSDLVINNMDSSCMCTSASIAYNGVESPIFGMSMHGENPKGWSLTIPPGEVADLKIFYDPNKHGELRGPVTRYITIMSNDPVNFREKVKIELNQVP